MTGHEHHHHASSAADEGMAEPKPAGPGTIYTCPMHPEVRQVGPGICPICGMTLEPVTATAETGPSPELADMTRRFRVGLALSVPVFVLEMGGHLPFLMGLVSPKASGWIQFGLGTPVVLWAGWPFFQRGWASPGSTASSPYWRPASSHPRSVTCQAPFLSTSRRRL